MPLKAYQKVKFELSFTSTQYAAGDNAFEDSAGCEIEIDTADDRYWKPTASDGSYTCVAGGCSDATNTYSSYTLTPESADAINWIEVEDNEDVRKSRYCWAANDGVDATWYPYQCE